MGSGGQRGSDGERAIGYGGDPGGTGERGESGIRDAPLSFSGDVAL